MYKKKKRVRKMKICLNDMEIVLNDAEADYTRNLARKMINSITQQIDEQNAMSTGMSLVLQLHLLTGEILNALEPEAIQNIFKDSKMHNITPEDLKKIVAENQQE